MTILLLALLCRVLAAQATVSGVVRDSIARAPLANATVQIVDPDNLARLSRTVLSDSLGRFSFEAVPAGRYTLGFFHPMLDSLGVAPPLRQVDVVDARPVRADLAIPSPARLRAAICGARRAADSGAVVVGTVRSTVDRAPIPGVTVTGDWLELSFTKDGVVSRIPRLVATTGDNGWFALCDVPSAGTMTLIATRGADSTDRIEVEVPAGRFLRRELYLGRRTDDGRLSGTVITVAQGQPVAGAQVSIVGGPRTRANERGEWTLADAPSGTRTLDVRAVGYYPEHMPVDVIPGAPPIRTSLFTLKAILDTVKVTAARLKTSADATGFELRRRSGIGRFLTADDIARGAAFYASDVLRRVPGVSVDAVNGIRMRGAFGECVPALYVNGRNVPSLSPTGLEPGDIDILVSPKDIAGIEVYHDHVPPQFHWGLSDCGAVVIWTK